MKVQRSVLSKATKKLNQHVISTLGSTSQASMEKHDNRSSDDDASTAGSEVDIEPPTRVVKAPPTGTSKWRVLYELAFVLAVYLVTR